MAVCSIVVGLCEAEDHGGNSVWLFPLWMLGNREDQRGTQGKIQLAKTNSQRHVSSGWVPSLKFPPYPRMPLNYDSMSRFIHYYDPFVSQWLVFRDGGGFTTNHYIYIYVHINIYNKSITAPCPSL